MNELFPIGSRVVDIDAVRDGIRIVGTVVEKPQQFKEPKFNDYAYILWEGDSFATMIHTKYLAIKE